MTYEQVLEDEFCLRIISRFQGIMRRLRIPDVEQEANLVISTAIASYDENHVPKPQKFTTHLWVGFRNRLSYLHHNRNGRYRKYEKQFKDYSYDEKSAEIPDLTLMDNLKRNEHSDYVRRCLSRISLNARAVIEKVYFEDMTILEASKALSCSHTTIVNRTNQAYKELRMIIEKDRAEGKF